MSEKGFIVKKKKFKFITQQQNEDKQAHKHFTEHF